MRLDRLRLCTTDIAVRIIILRVMADEGKGVGKVGKSIHKGSRRSTEIDL